MGFLLDREAFADSERLKESFTASRVEEEVGVFISKEDFVGCRMRLPVKPPGPDVTEDEVMTSSFVSSSNEV